MRLTLAVSALALIAAPVHAQEKPSSEVAREAAEKQRGTVADEIEAATARAPVEEQSAVTKGSVTVSGQRIGYTATAGTLTIRDDEGKPTASVFFTGYTRDGQAPGKRPVTFFYNGGPGSASFWLHMGSFAPVRVTTGNPEYIRPAPYGFGSNPYSLIDKSDLVFIDMVGAGWSRPLGTKTGKDFWGVDQDADAFARAIQRYLEKNARFTSPKFLFGESYGTLRNGVLAAMLEERGISLNGIVYLSTIMNYGVRQPGYDQNYMTLFPGYAATAWYHNRVPNRPAQIGPFLDEVRTFVTGPYAAALAKGAELPPAEAQQVAQQMSRYIGISPQYLLRANLRLELPQFMTELLRDQGLTVGRLDSRYTLIDADVNADSPVDDPASTATTGAYIATFEDYARRTLGYKTDMAYRPSARGEGWKWDWSHRTPGSRGSQTSPNTAVDLAHVMRTNPYLQTLFLNGYYDLATPFFGTEFDVSHMLLATQLRPNVQFKYYESGHMIYNHPESLAAMHRDIGQWYDMALDTARRPTPPVPPSAAAPVTQTPVETPSR